MATSVTLNGISYPIPTKGNVDWPSLSQWIVAANTAIENGASGQLVTPVFNVKNYGAVGDGSTDDTTAIAAAQAALALKGTAGGTLYFPTGTYKYTATLRFGVSTTQKNVRISGDGVASVLKPTGNFSTSACIEFRDCDFWQVGDIKIDCSARTGTGDALLVDGCSHGFVTSTDIVSSTRYGVRIDQISGVAAPAYNYVEANTFSGMASANVYVKPGTTGNVVNQNSGLRPVSATISVKDYGAVGDGVTDDTNAVKAAIAALWRFGSGYRGGALYFPAGDYKISDTLDFSGKWGFVIQGESMQGTKILCSGMSGKDLIYALGSQHWGVRDITLWGDQASRPRAMIHSRMASGYVFAAYNIYFQNVWCSADLPDAFDYGIYFSSDGSGNNSEVNYLNVDISYAKEACVRKEGAQAKDHYFFGVNLALSKVLIDNALDTGPGGSTGCAVYGGSLGSATVAAVTLTYPGDATILDGVRSENCYRFVDGGTVYTDQVSPLTIRNCSIDAASTSATTDFIRSTFVGPFIFQGNNVFRNTTPPQITVSGKTFGHVTDNCFVSTNAVAYSPVVVEAGSPHPHNLEIHHNAYTDATGALADTRRLEPMDVAAPAATFVFQTSGTGNSGQYILGVNLSAFTAAALTQTVTALTLPKGAKVKSAYLYWNDKLVLPAAPTITAKVGTTSGGDEYLLATDVSASPTQFVGKATADLGAALTTGYAQGGYVQDYFNATPVYLTLTSSAGNLGTGAATRLTAGTLFLIMEVDVLPRWLSA
jgi:hypothetical protein